MRDRVSAIFPSVKDLDLRQHNVMVSRQSPQATLRSNQAAALSVHLETVGMIHHAHRKAAKVARRFSYVVVGHARVRVACPRHSLSTAFQTKCRAARVARAPLRFTRPMAGMRSRSRWRT